ncbi:DNA methylase [Candidatus Magnetomorum sp. HK-1]|nr:DNA methylase [Candidatus Magnetomorum sp. HK-1]
MLKPFEWKDKPALIEHLFPVQKISAESYKEQMAGAGKTLTALGSYWKGRKPLILNKACILGSLLPVTEDRLKDLEIFELLMGMDSESMQKRLEEKLPASKRDTVCKILLLPYNEQVKNAKRPEEISDHLFFHIWERVNKHLGTSVSSLPELVEQIGIARFGRRPKVADVFCGSGQIPFEAARLGCDVYASDLNPIACLLTWGGFNIVGAIQKKRAEIERIQKKLAEKVQKEIDALDVENDGNGWQAKAFLYCVEVQCPETGWKVPLIPSLIISKGRKVVARLIPMPNEKRYDIKVCYVENDDELDAAQFGTIQNSDVVHSPDGITQYRVNIKTIRGDYKEGKENKNQLRMWKKIDFVPRQDDIFQERLYCIQWMKKKSKEKNFDYEFRSVTQEDIAREQKVIDYVSEHLEEWQEKGYIPDMVIESGDKTDEPIRTRGWTHWHHLWPYRQLLYLALIKKNIETPEVYVILSGLLDYTSKLCRWTTSSKGSAKIGGGKRTGGASDNPTNVFYNQALNTFFNYGIRSLSQLFEILNKKIKSEPFTSSFQCDVITNSAENLQTENDIYITDPPYGDAVKYEEITEFFIAWLRKNPPKEFAHWTWDSRRSLAIKGEDEGFRQAMIATYRKMTQKMPDNGIQVLMFTHQSGSIWADMANIIWASGLQVTAAWYVVTETDSALRQGAIEFAVQTAVQFLVPVGFEKGEWQNIQAVERFYLKMAEMEHQGAKTLDNYQNFAKAFKVRHFDHLMSDKSKANSARLKLSTEFKNSLMSGDAEIVGTPLRALLYSLFELSKEIEVDDVLLHLMENCPNYLANKPLLAKMADYLAEKRRDLKSTKIFKPDVEASCARVLAEAIRNQRL